METFLFSGYARLPQDVSHQALYKRVGIVVEVDETGLILAASTTLMMDLAREFFCRLVSGQNIITGRDEIEAMIRRRYRGHSQAAIVSAMRKIYEAVDASPVAARRPAALAAAARKEPAGAQCESVDGGQSQAGEQPASADDATPSVDSSPAASSVSANQNAGAAESGTDAPRFG